MKLDPDKLAVLRDLIAVRENDHIRSRSVIDELVEHHGATHRFASGTWHLRMAGVHVTNTAGGWNLLNAWRRKAAAAIERAAA